MSTYWTDRYWPMYVGPDSPLQTLDSLIPRILAAKCVAVDCETAAPIEDEEDDEERSGSALDFREATLVGVSLTWREDTPPPELLYEDSHPFKPPNAEPPFYPSVYIPLEHQLYRNAGEGTRNFLRELFASKKPKVTHGGFTFDGPMFFFRKGWRMARPWMDTGIMAGLWDETKPKKLKVLGDELLHFKTMEYGKMGKLPLDAIAPNIVFRYACQDSHLTYGLLEWFADYFQTHYPSALQLLNKVEFPMAEIFARMTYKGIRVNFPLLRAYQAACDEVISKGTAKARELLGKDVNFKSPKQVVAAFGELGITIPNAQAETLATVDHPAAKMITLVNTFSIYKSRYVDGVSKWAWSDGRVRPLFVLWEVSAKGKRAGTETGRASARNPLVHQFPKEPIRFPIDTMDLSQGVHQLVEKVWDPVRDEWEYVPAMNCRALLMASEGRLLVATDASQIEPRVTAAITGEPLLVDGYQRGIGIYKPSGARLFHKREEEVSKKTREYKLAKTYILTKDYMGGAETVYKRCLAAGILDITLNDVKRDLDRLKKEMPLVEAFPEKVVKPQLLANGYSETIFGRRRHAPFYHPRDHRMLRQHNNFLRQSTAFQIMKQATIRIDRKFAADNLAAELVLQVHDEDVADTPFEEVFRVAEIMETEIAQDIPEFPHPVPLAAETEVGKFYGRMVDLETYRDMCAFYGGPVPDPYAYEPTYRKAKAEKEKQNVEHAPWEEPAATLVGDSPEARKSRFVAIATDVRSCKVCTHAPFQALGHRKCGPLGKITEPVDLVWVVGHPDDTDLNATRLLSGGDGSLLKQEAYQAGLPLPPNGKALVVPALWCGAPDGEGITVTHIQHCRNYLDRILELAQPKTIVALGSIAMRSALRIREAGLEERVGWHCRPDGVWVMVTYAPRYLMRAPGYTGQFREHLQLVKERMKEVSGK